jgi:hypothetical protein
MCLAKLKNCDGINCDGKIRYNQQIKSIVFKIVSYLKNKLCFCSLSCFI